MAYTITAKTRSILNQIEKNPSVVLEIEGVDFVASSSATFTVNKYDSGLFWDQTDPIVFWDGELVDDSVKSYIDLKQSTKTISQQIFPDKEGSSSISTFTISMVDKNGEVSRTFALNAIEEILGKKCTVYLGFSGKGATYPEDYITIMNGFIVDYFYNAGSVNFTVSHADGLRRQAILTEYTATLTSSIDNVTTTIPVSSTDGFNESQDALTSFIKIGDEIMEVTSVDSATQFTVIRERFSTVAASHDNDSDIKSFYQLQGRPLDLAQKIMLSNEDNSFFDSDIGLLAINVFGSQTLENSIIFDSFDIERVTGLIVGDIVNVSTIGNLTISGFGRLDSGFSFISFDETLDDLEDASALTWSFKSQYNVLNFGLDMKPFEVDNITIEEIKNLFSVNFIEMNFPIEDGIEDARDFINKELYFVAACYGIPRNGRSSVRFLSPPLTIERLPVLNETNILNMTDLKPIRSINKFYYNDILFAFNKSFVDGDFKSFTEFLNVDSLNRFKVGKKQLKIESQGYDSSSETDLILSRIASRFLDRYKQAATYIKGIKLPFRVGFNLQVGDVLFFGGENTKIADYNTGLRQLPLEKYEVINQKISLDGVVEIDILSTGFAIEGTFATISPSSKVASATTTSITLKPISNLDEFENEGDKYLEFIGVKIRVRSADYTYDEITTLNSIDPQNLNRIIVGELPSAPSADYILEIADYQDQADFGTNDITDLLKLKHCFFMGESEITSVTDDKTFDVEDGTKFFAGQKVAYRGGLYVRDEQNLTIDTVVSNTVTLTEDLPFTPLAGDELISLGFSDGLDGYQFL